MSEEINGNQPRHTKQPIYSADEWIALLDPLVKPEPCSICGNEAVIHYPATMAAVISCSKPNCCFQLCWSYGNPGMPENEGAQLAKQRAVRWWNYDNLKNKVSPHHFP